MINNVVLIGRLTRDVDLRYTPSNIAVATFNLAVNRNFKNQDGEREADFINCVMWQMQIVKHALQYYVQREGADEHDLMVERNLLSKITQEIEEFKENVMKNPCRGGK